MPQFYQITQLERRYSQREYEARFVYGDHEETENKTGMKKKWIEEHDKALKKKQEDCESVFKFLNGYESEGRMLWRWKTLEHCRTWLKAMEEKYNVIP